ncbi:hypothetical protein CLU97_0078 [Chryseobacterium sp. 7]|uniref:hypothetical protein n=1 Tax=Chryseobacterium sp. 7 TaxID=2035214 RepID=UPI000EB0BF0F|nr:hypothetical protein [Chryseobacterium sp. 7]RLJ30697.1 hypothetical protein CLU97_0078 [Chryseobacterium sp. 7]
MNKLNFFITTVLVVLFSCKKNNNGFSNSNENLGSDTVVNTVKHEVKNSEKNSEKLEKPEYLEGDYCFLKVEGKDSTIVKLRILSDDDIRGEMIWQPWQKDGAVGNLIGKINSMYEMELLYEYTIDGQRQTETKVMKIEKDKLFIKIGELWDSKSDGNLTYKDVSKAVFREIFDPINCK